MDLIPFNFYWMVFNVMLSLIAVVLGFLFLDTQKKYLKYFYGIFWLLFLPNTIYLFTDLINLIMQWGKVGTFVKLVFIVQYGILEVFGLFTFILGLYPLEKYLSSFSSLKKTAINTTIIFLNFIVGFGITLGRVERINSWDALFSPNKVVNASLHILKSPDLILLCILFGLFGDLLYFLLRKPIIRFSNTCLNRFGVLL